jgi:hypothetical protein
MDKNIYLIGGVLLLSIILLSQKTNKVNASGKSKKKNDKKSKKTYGSDRFSAAEFNQKRLNNLYVLQRK